MKKDEDIEVLSFDDLEEDDFMLNNTIHKKDNLIIPDDKIDTQEEKDFLDELELDKKTNEVLKEKKEIKTKIEEKIEDNIEKEDIKVEKKSKSKEKKKAEKSKKKKKIAVDEEDISKKKKRKKEKKPVKKSVFWMQVVFCTLSVLFIIGCFIHYGSRMIKYYKIYNPKNESGETIALIGNSITTNAQFATEGSGLYRISGSYIYKGDDVNNYLMYNNALWRIIKINGDGSLDLISNDYVNALDWNSTMTTYKDSDIRAWLNDTYLNSLNKDILTTVTYCEDLVNDLSSITCNISNSEDYVRLLGINEFLNSQVDGKTYLANDTDNMWLYNSSEEKVWFASGTSVSSNASDSGYLLKAVVHIKNSAQLISGEGTLEKPYVIEKENQELLVGSNIKLGEDIWTIYEVNDGNIKLAYSGVLSNTYRYSLANNTFDVASANSLAAYLNTTYLDSLSYKDILLDTTWYNGSYKSYKDVLKSTVTSKVGLLNVNDIKTGINTEYNYYILTPGDSNYEYMIGSELRQSRVTISRNIKPTISIKKAKIESGKGTTSDPYILEV